MPTRLQTPPPPVSTFSEGGGGSGWIELIKAGDSIEAHLIAGRLTEAGVEVKILPDRAAPGAWLYGGSNPWAPVTVLVRRRQLEEARLVLAEVSWAAPPAERDRPPRPRRNVPLLWWVTAIALGILFFAVALLQATRATAACAVPVICDDPAQPNQDH
jgi:Putative prokaryotic signal transducing protein